MIARLAPSIPLVRRTAAIGVVSLFVTRLAKVGNPPTAADRRTIQDGPQSTLSGHSLQTAATGRNPPKPPYTARTGARLSLVEAVIRSSARSV
jgi:hypothetical protein